MYDITIIIWNWMQNKLVYFRPHFVLQIMVNAEVNLLNILSLFTSCILLSKHNIQICIHIVVYIVQKSFQQKFLILKNVMASFAHTLLYRYATFCGISTGVNTDLVICSAKSFTGIVSGYICTLKNLTYGSSKLKLCFVNTELWQLPITSIMKNDFCSRFFVAIAMRFFFFKKFCEV